MNKMDFKKKFKVFDWDFGKMKNAFTECILQILISKA